ncbi:MAG: hypothetical protein L6V88_09905 [Anaerotruncus sp.]|nr:MAG: hypothetical protein L6V88_09905 [Anaerotruncus sp.]
MGKYILDEERLKSVEENYKRILESVKECAVKAGRSEKCRAPYVRNQNG